MSIEGVRYRLLEIGDFIRASCKSVERRIKIVERERYGKVNAVSSCIVEAKDEVLWHRTLEAKVVLCSIGNRCVVNRAIEIGARGKGRACDCGKEHSRWERIGYAIRWSEAIDRCGIACANRIPWIIRCIDTLLVR